GAQHNGHGSAHDTQQGLLSCGTHPPPPRRQNGEKPPPDDAAETSHQKDANQGQTALAKIQAITFTEEIGRPEDVKPPDRGGRDRSHYVGPGLAMTNQV